MLTPENIRELVKDCSCGALRIQVCQDDERLYLQISALSSDLRWQMGRKWMLSPHMVPGEVVQTALAAVLAWYEHEAREAFKYRGTAIFSPHISLYELLARAYRVETRQRS